MLHEPADSLLAAARGVLPAVDEGFKTYVYDGALALFLPVVNPPHYGHDAVHERAVVHAVLAVEGNSLAVVLIEERAGVDEVVFIAEEAEDALLLVVVDVAEVLFGHVPVFLHQRLVNVELLHAVLTGAEELLLAGEPMALHGVGNLEGGVHQDAVEAVQLLGIHAAHRRTQNEVGLLGGAGLAQQVECLLRMDGQVGSNDDGFRKNGA